MSLFIYDGSFEGLLSAVFESFARKCEPTDIARADAYQVSLLDEVCHIKTDSLHAERVLSGVDARSDGKASKLVYQLFLSELPGIEMHIYRFVHVLVNARNPAILDNFANEQVLYTAQVVRMIGREVHRMHAFVRFQKSKSGVYCAVIEPDFNVLPLLGDHFIRRFADQPWVILDTRRHYGLQYDLTTMAFVDESAPIIAEMAQAMASGTMDGGEESYQQLWKKYFQAVNISARKNDKLHLRHLPKRYWKYLIEKQISWHGEKS